MRWGFERLEPFERLERRSLSRQDAKTAKEDSLLLSGFIPKVKGSPRTFGLESALQSMVVPANLSLRNS
jgi:hypothetical protein